SESIRASEMERIAVRLRLTPGCRRAYEHASSKGEAIRSVAISLQWPVQMTALQPYATDGQAQRKTPTAAGRQQCRCDRSRLRPSQAVDARHKPKPSAYLPGCDARCRATREQLRNRKTQMLLSVQRWTHESRLQRGRKAQRPRDMGSADPR